MIVDARAALTYAQSRADQLDEPFTVYYIPEANVYAIGKIGSLMQLKRTYAGREITKLITIVPSSWQADTEEEL